MKRLKQWRARRQMMKARRILANVDTAMKAAHLPRAERRRFWNEVRTGRVDVSTILGKD